MTTIQTKKQKMNTLRTFIAILIMAISTFSCSNDDGDLNYNNNSFVYIETASFQDYSGNSKLLVSDGNNTRPIKILNKRIQYQIIDSKIVFLDGQDIIEFNPKSNKTRIIANLPNILIHSFHVSPNMDNLAFSNYEDIFIVELNSGTMKNITEHLEGNFRIPKWSPDGNSLLVRNGIPIVGPNDEAPTSTGNFKVFSLSQQSFQDIEMFDQFASPGNAEWSPDSKLIAYGQYQAIFTFDIENRQLKRITSQEVVATNPKFSTDGSKMSYFSSDLSDNGNNWQNFLTIYDISNNSSKIVNDIYSYDVSWKYDSSEILYCTKTGIFSYNLSKGTISQIVNSNESIFLHSVKFLN